jgi:hypothetical protein
MIIADYRCGCTWVGKRSECIEYCAKHGEPRRQVMRINGVPEKDTGWDWQVKLDRLDAAVKP